VSRRPLDQLLAIMARLRGPRGCPWDRQQDHRSLRYHAVEEVYELLEAIEAGDDDEIAEELGDLLLHIVFHCQLGRERGAFDFRHVTRRLVNKLIHRHPHVFGAAPARTAAAVWAQWDRLKQAEKHGTSAERKSALDGVPRRLPALLRAEKLWKKAVRAGLVPQSKARPRRRLGASARRLKTRRAVAARLLALACHCQERGWSAEDLLRGELRRQEQRWRQAERQRRRQPRR
jgi:uncharacterized protein YabN with tetrapyrrole methylase and pyrophosphatase domain